MDSVAVGALRDIERLAKCKKIEFSNDVMSQGQRENGVLRDRLDGGNIEDMPFKHFSSCRFLFARRKNLIISEFQKQKIAGIDKCPKVSE